MRFLKLIVFPILLLLHASFGQSWSQKSVGKLWQISWNPIYDFNADSWTQRPVFSCPSRTISQPPEYIEISKCIQTKGKVILEYCISDDFENIAPGHNFLEILINEETVLSYDVSGSQVKAGTIELDANSVVTVRAVNKKLISNFCVKIKILKLNLITENNVIELFDHIDIEEPKELPPDLALATVPLQGLEWTNRAITVQPWGKSQYDLMYNPDQLPDQLSEKFGFNTILVQPPAAYNRGKYKLSDEQFRSALNAYRRAGYKVVIYSSIMHVGHGPEWQSGRLAAMHPDWLQIDASGGKRKEYGSYWLCPSTDALQYTLNYTKDLVNQYDPDGIMLDNNEFIYANEGGSGLTCYCQSCQTKFREYVLRRFSDKTQEFFGVEPNNVKIPVEPGALYNLWLHWRNILWAQATEMFRRELRPKVLFANTQYLYKNGALATDLQYGSEDVVFSESRTLTSIQMSQKMLLGHALAVNKPVWNYLGTFTEQNPDLLRSPSELARIIAASMGHCTEPLLVYYGFDQNDNENAASRQLISDMFRFFSQNPNLYEGLNRWANTAVIFPLRSRNYFESSLFSKLLESAIQKQIPVCGIADFNLKDVNMDRYKIIIAQDSKCIASDEIAKIFLWVKKGGQLICSTDFGLYDEIGRPRRSSPLRKILPDFKKDKMRYENGCIVLLQDNELKDLSLFEDFQFKIEPESVSMEIVPYFNDVHCVIHLVNHGKTSKAAWKLILPRTLFNTFKNALYDSPECYTTEQLRFIDNTIEIPATNSYGVITLRKE